jgi:uncharacterized protein (TIGR02246 family)
MKTYVALAVAISGLMSVSVVEARPSQQPASRSGAPQRAAIVGLIKSYEQALNASDVDGVVKLYTNDAVLLPPNAPFAVGITAVRATYTGIFQAIHLHLTFEIAEVNVMAPNWAFLRSTSKGSMTILATGAQAPSSNHELFVLHKTQGHWKLARYSFSSVLPAA